MSFACDACKKPVPVGKGSDWIDRCPWCSGPVTYLGLKAVAPASPAGRKPVAHPRAAPGNHRAHRVPGGRLPEWVAWAGAIVFLLFVLLGTCLYLASTLPARPSAHGPELLAVADTLTAAEPDSRALVRAESPPREKRQPDPGPPPVPDEPPLQKPPAEKTPPAPQPKAPEQPPAEQQKPAEQQAALDQLPKPREEPPTGSLLDLPRGGQQVGQQPGMPPGGVKPLAKDKKSEAVFMGVKARGKRICIIADCSGSMAFNNRMRRLKVELKKTVENLTPEQEFYIIYFSDTATPMRTKKTWWRGGEDLKRVFNWIDAQPPGGGTEPTPAFHIAFRLKPRPDAIFFLTDGLIPLTVPHEVARLNGKGGNKIPIHTILFGGELAGAENRVVMVPTVVRGRTIMVRREIPVAKMEKDQGQLQQVSRDSGGTHRFIPDEGRAGR